MLGKGVCGKRRWRSPNRCGASGLQKKPGEEIDAGQCRESKTKCSYRADGGFFWKSSNAALRRHENRVGLLNDLGGKSRLWKGKQYLDIEKLHAMSLMNRKVRKRIELPSGSQESKGWRDREQNWGKERRMTLGKLDLKRQRRGDTIH